MSAPTSPPSTLDPSCEAQFLTLLLATARAAARTASGEQLTVIGHYLSGMEKRQETLHKRLSRQGKRRG